jgi:hypothetical protein
MKEFSIHGRLIADDCKGHQEMVIKLTRLLLNNGFRFVGETKEVNKEK